MAMYITEDFYSGKNIGNRLHVNLKKYHKDLNLSLVLVCTGAQLENMLDFEFSSKKQLNFFIFKWYLSAKILGVQRLGISYLYHIISCMPSVTLQCY